MEITAIILAAGQGRRMKSSIPKVLHKIANASFLEIILRTLGALNITDIRVVASPELTRNHDFQVLAEQFSFSQYVQDEPKGTADASRCAISNAEKNYILILNGDCPLFEVSTIKNLINHAIAYQADVMCVGFKATDPHGYGRMVTFGEDLIEIIEQRDLSAEQESLALCNAGTYLLSPQHAYNLLQKVGNANIAGEFYLTDIVKVAHLDGLRISYITAKEREVLGINNPVQKSKAEKVLQRRLRERALEQGVTMVAPQTVFLSYDTQFGTNVVIEPFVVIGSGVKIGDDTTIASFSHLSETVIGANCHIGPYARIRPQTTLEDDVKIGNFVEVKASKIERGAKASHLSYIGDAVVGEEANIGAGTIFCNFDGYHKHPSSIGKRSFVGSNVSLVAPINIGDDAIIGAGSVITEDVDDDTLAIARSRQSNYRQKGAISRKKK